MNSKSGKPRRPKEQENEKRTEEPDTRSNSTAAPKPAPTIAESLLFSREAVESIVVAIVLALLFRAFEAEAFVIPTGSMAPTLLGRNRDLECSACGYLFPFGDSEEQAVPNLYGGVCPLCGFPKPIQTDNPNDRSANGDRILVNKFAYQFWEPERWDVIVFKNPANAKQNYIKRLLGLANETLRIHAGDIFVRPVGESAFRLERKPVDKIQPMLRLVHSTQHIPNAQIVAKWPSAWRADESVGASVWQISDDQQTYALPKALDQAVWLHYVHSSPRPHDWNLDGSLRSDARPEPRLITDFSGYNVRVRYSNVVGQPSHQVERSDGYHWVGDLAVECDAKIQGSTGHILLQLIEAGNAFVCDIDVETGQAKIAAPNGTSFSGSSKSVQNIVGSTAIRGEGNYRLTFANIDDRLVLWVDGEVIEFTDTDGDLQDGSFDRTGPVKPVWSETEPGDLHPVRVGAQGVAVEFSSIDVSRDTYYIAVDHKTSFSSSGSLIRHPGRDIETTYSGQHDYEGYFATQEIRWEAERLFMTPDSWAQTELFDRRRTVEFTIKEDEFFPMGDNSPVSQDARLWPAKAIRGPINGIGNIGGPADRDLLIGKAFLVYWPHGWYVAKLPIVPNVRRMGSIR